MRQQRKPTSVLSQGCVLVLPRTSSQNRTSLWKVTLLAVGLHGQWTWPPRRKSPPSSCMEKHVLSLLPGGLRSYLQSPTLPKSSCRCRKGDPLDTPFAWSSCGRNVFSQATEKPPCHQHGWTHRPLWECEGVQPLILQLEKLKDSLRLRQKPTPLDATFPAGLPHPYPRQNSSD